MRRLTTVLAVAAALAASSAMAEDQEKEVTIQEVPAPVRAAIEKLSAGGTIDELEQEKKGDKVTYSVEVKKDGKTTEYDLSADGAVLKTEVDEEDDDDEGKEEAEEKAVAFDSLPAPVQKAFKAASGGAAATTATMEREGGIDVYEIEFVKDGVKTSVEASANGAILETERELKPDEAPAGVKEAIQKRFPGAEMKAVEEITPIVYEVKLLKDGKVKEVKLNGAGRPVGNDDDDDDEDDD